MPNTALARPGVIDEPVPAWRAQVEDDPDEAALDDDDLEDDDWDDDDLDELEFGDDENDDDWDDDDSEENLEGFVADDEDKEGEKLVGKTRQAPEGQQDPTGRGVDGCGVTTSIVARSRTPARLTPTLETLLLPPAASRPSATRILFPRHRLVGGRKAGFGGTGS